MTWSVVPLADVCDVKRGTTITQKHTRHGDIPVVAGGVEAAYFHDTANRDANVITISSSGANAGFVNFWNSPIFASDCSTVTSRRDDIDISYVFYFLRSKQKDIYALRQGAAQPHVYAKDIAKLQIPLPPFHKQRRIVDLLSRAEGIVRLRREAQKKAAEIIPALFLDMFGDPATNPMGWVETTLGNVVNEFRYGTSQKSGQIGLPTLRIPNVIGDSLDPTEMKLVSVTDAEANRLRLRDNDFLFVRTNGNVDYVGRSAVYYSKSMQRAGFDGQNCLYASYLIRARLQLDIINPRFLQTFLSSLEGRKRLREQARTSAGQYNINTEGLSSVRILLPPVQLQAKFEDLCRPLFGLYELQLSGKIKAEETFSALLARVFSATSANSGFVKAA